MHAEKNKGADQSAQLNSLSALLFFSKSNHRFHSLSQDATFTMPYIKTCKSNNAFAVDFQCLRSNCGSVVFWVVAVLIWPSLLCPARLDQSAQL